jgi:hypothetical protein
MENSNNKKAYSVTYTLKKGDSADGIVVKTTVLPNVNSLADIIDRKKETNTDSDIQYAKTLIGLDLKNDLKRLHLSIPTIMNAIRTAKDRISKRNNAFSQKLYSGHSALSNTEPVLVKPMFSQDEIDNGLMYESEDSTLLLELLKEIYITNENINKKSIINDFTKNPNLINGLKVYNYAVSLARQKSIYDVQFIGNAFKESTTLQYKTIFEKTNQANTEAYIKDTIVFLDNDGSLAPLNGYGELSKSYKPLDVAIQAGSTILMDNQLGEEYLNDNVFTLDPTHPTLIKKEKSLKNNALLHNYLLYNGYNFSIKDNSVVVYTLPTISENNVKQINQAIDNVSKQTC